MLSSLRSIFILISAVIATHVNGADLTVFAAASLTDSLKELATTYEKQSGDKVTFNFAASSLLARQIQDGAPADIFLSADEAKMDGLEKNGLIVPDTRRDLLSNSLVVVAPADGTLTIGSAADLVDKTQKLALADPKAVPAGIYAREYLTSQGLWEKLEPRVVPTENVRAALAAVESGNVDAGFVYKTDANISNKVKVIFTVGPDQGPKIRYPIAVLKETKDQTAANKFVRFLESEEALKVFEKYGFIVKW